MDSGSVVERLRDTVPSALSGEPVVCAYLFGSVARGEARARSDIDVAVLLDDAPSTDPLEARLRIAATIEQRAGVGPVEVVVLNEAALQLVGRVLTDRLVLFSRDEARRVEFESLAMRRFLDFDIHARRLDEELLRATAERRR